MTSSTYDTILIVNHTSKKKIRILTTVSKMTSSTYDTILIVNHTSKKNQNLNYRERDVAP